MTYGYGEIYRESPDHGGNKRVHILKEMMLVILSCSGVSVVIGCRIRHGYILQRLQASAVSDEKRMMDLARELGREYES